MQVEAQRINEKGKFVPTKERSAMPKFQGSLSVFEFKDTHLQRTVRVARLVSIVDGNNAEVLPELHDVELLFIKEGRIRIRGFETIDGTEYGQAWDIKVTKC